jgi:hypothetical protein
MSNKTSKRLPRTPSVRAPKTPSVRGPKTPSFVIEAPKSRKDPRYLNEGTSKMIWLMVPNAERERLDQPRDNTVVVNAFDKQLFENGKSDKILNQKMEEQQNEYEFTRLIQGIFPKLIPSVYSMNQVDIDPKPRFRYTKDRCEQVSRTAHLFHEMIRISDELIKQGWVYLDMKPENIGLFEGRLVLMDTDPYSFYRIPHVRSKRENERVHKFYTESCHMIILLYCFNHVTEIPTKVLHDFIRSKGYNEAYFHLLYKQVPPTESKIASFNNDMYQEVGAKVRLRPDKIMAPKTYIRHYGHYNGIHALTRLVQITDNRSKPYKKPKVLLAKSLRSYRVK